jgi:hypothetical protein
MFYADKLYWDSVNGKISTARAYNLDVDASTCTPNTTAPNGTYNSVR